MINKSTKFLIVGLGLLGGSYALVLKKEGYYVSAIARRKETIDYALKHNMIDEGSIEVGNLVSQADVIIFGLYPTTMIDWILKYQHLFKENALLTDVSGVKSGIVETIQYFLRKDVEFISAHPMAGKENSGVEYANTEMFKHANYIITPTEKNTQEAIDFSYDLAYTLHFNHIALLSCEEHDHMIGFLSQLTHVIAVSLMNTHDNEKLVEYTGDSFRDLTRIANINEDLWAELFLNNKDYLLKSMQQFEEQFDLIKKSLVKNDINTLKEAFKKSSKRRENLEK